VKPTDIKWKDIRQAVRLAFVKGKSSWNLFLSQKGSKPPKRLLYEDKTLGRCPKPYPPFEKGGAKTFIFASLLIKLIYLFLVPLWLIKKFIKSVYLC
jgi:hypothetical protein